MPAQRDLQKRPNHGTGAVRRDALKKRRAREERVRRLRLPAALGAVVIVAAVAVLATRGGSSGKAPAGARSTFGTTTKAATDQPVDGIPCESGEQLKYHVHAHLAVYVDGKPETIPEGIGINSTKPCIYWLHTHTQDGVVHIEAPAQQAFTLAQLFDEWGQPLDATHVASATGAVTAFVDGQPYNGDPRAIAFGDHSLVQLNVGAGNPAAQPFSFPAGLT